jgi:hypothetical protein
VAALGAAGQVSAASFTDVPKDHYAVDAINFLADRGVLNGYQDGSFKPDKKVNRAEALKVIASAFIPDSASNNLKSQYDDVEDAAWYLPAIEWALDKGAIIDGPSKTKQFHPTRTVTKVEFLKMLLNANGIDMKSFGDITLPLSSDVNDVKAWYYPSMRYAIATGTTAAGSTGMIGPARDMTRGDVALIMYRFTLFREGRRTQDLLTLTRQEVEDIITSLSKGDIKEAEYGSSRAILIARGALLAEPDAPAVKVAVKIAEGYRALTRAYRAGLSGDLDTVIKLSTDAGYLAEQARKMSPDATTIANQLSDHAKSFSQQAKQAK